MKLCPICGSLMACPHCGNRYEQGLGHGGIPLDPAADQIAANMRRWRAGRPFLHEESTSNQPPTTDAVEILRRRYSWWEQEPPTI